MKKYIQLLLVSLVLGGCSVTGPMGTSQNKGPGAVLLAQAETQQQLGNLSKSIALVERAVRIEPRNAYAWHHLAKLYFEAENYKKAEQFALRSNQFAGQDRQLVNENSRLIESIRLKQ